MTRMTWLTLLSATTVATLLAACGETTSPVGSAGRAETGDPCAEDGATARSVDGCNSCTCTDGAWACTEMACGECVDGETQPAGDGCNTCSCLDGTWACTLMACSMCPDPGVEDPGTACTDNIVFAKDPDTGTCCEYSTPCVAPDGWEQFGSLETCQGGGTCPAPVTSSDMCLTVLVYAKDPTSGLCCQYGSPCNAPADWEQFYTQEACEAGGTVTGFACGDKTCTAGVEYCSMFTGGVPGSVTTYTCEPFVAGCASCDCLDVTAACTCGETDGTVSVFCAAP